MTGRLLVLGDSLTYHGPTGPELVTDPRLWPQQVAASTGRRLDLLARQGWTARDAWWALTKDPVAWSVLLPRADVLVLAVGGMDALPASLPTYLREGIPYVRPAAAAAPGARRLPDRPPRRGAVDRRTAAGPAAAGHRPLPVPGRGRRPALPARASRWSR